MGSAWGDSWGSGGGGPAAPMLAVADNGDGESATATITSSSSGSTNTLYATTLNGGFASQGSRSGNGTIDAAPGAGNWVWYVASSLSGGVAISNVIFQSIAGTGQSIYYQILATVAANITAAAIGGLPAVSVRKKPRLFQADGGQACLVCPGPGGEQIVKQAFAKTVVWSYPVLVMVIQPGNLIESATLNAHMYTREQLRNALFTVGAVGEAYDLAVETREVAILQADLGSQYEVSGFQMNYRVTEQRIN